MPLMLSLHNDLRGMSSREMTRRNYPNLSSASDWLKICFFQSKQYSNLGIVTCHQYGISLLIPQVLFSPNFHRQTLQTDLYIFPYKISSVNLIKEQTLSTLVINLLNSKHPLLIAYSSLLGLKQLK